MTLKSNIIYQQRRVKHERNSVSADVLEWSTKIDRTGVVPELSTNPMLS